MSPSTATRPVSEVVRIAYCPEHGLHGQRTECFVCGGPVDQVAMVPVVDPDRGPCACGCGHPKRGESDYASDACRTRQWKRETGYIHPDGAAARNARNGAQTRLLPRSRPGGRQLAYGVAVRVLASYLTEARVIADEAQARKVAETILGRALPKRQRAKTRTRTRGAA